MWPYPRMIAHRGGGVLAPENTMAGLRAGHAAGFRGVEFDVMLASDRVPVLMHDEEFGRTLAGAGRIAQTSSAMLGSMDAGSWLGPGWAGEAVPLYREAFDFCVAAGIFMNVEIKPSVGDEALTGEVVGHLTEQWLRDQPQAQVLFSSFSVAALQAARLAAPRVPQGLLVREIPTDWHEQLQALGAVSLHVEHQALDAASAAAVRAADIGLFCFTVNTRHRAAQLLAWGVDAICTDRIGLLPPVWPD